MKEHPILFSGPMVRAILDGRKTQTRRVVADRNSVGNFKGSELDLDDGAWADGFTGSHRQYLHSWLGAAARGRTGTGVHDVMERLYCRYEVGDRLWVKETFMGPTHIGDGDQGCVGFGVLYRADNTFVADRSGCACEGPCSGVRIAHPWKPSIFMPRSLSRLLLEVTEVRVERLQDISEEDAIAEGVALGFEGPIGPVGIDGNGPVVLFRRLWDFLNAKRGLGWDKNPWVWAPTFKTVTP